MVFTPALIAVLPPLITRPDKPPTRAAYATSCGVAFSASGLNVMRWYTGSSTSARPSSNASVAKSVTRFLITVFAPVLATVSAVSFAVAFAIEDTIRPEPFAMPAVRISTPASVAPERKPYPNSFAPSVPDSLYASLVALPAAPKPAILPEIMPAARGDSDPPEKYAIAAPAATPAMAGRLVPMPPATSPATCQPSDGLNHSSAWE